MTAIDLAAPEPFTTTRYRCRFCGRSWARKAAAARHIPRCWRNPAARSCKTCSHYELEPDGPYCLGTPCDCNQGYERCNAGMNLEQLGRRLPVGCPLWTAPCSDCQDPETVADGGDGKRYCRVDAGHRMAAGEGITYDENPADGEPPRVETDCRGSGTYDCPCEADGQPDGRCACCRSGEANGSCALMAWTP